MNNPVTELEISIEDWHQHPVTKRLMRLLDAELDAILTEEQPGLRFRDIPVAYTAGFSAGQADLVYKLRHKLKTLLTEADFIN